MSGDNVERKKKILDFIKEEEKNNELGVPLSKISNRLGIPFYTVQSELEDMKREGTIKENQKGIKYKYYKTTKKGEKTGS